MARLAFAVGAVPELPPLAGNVEVVRLSNELAFLPEAGQEERSCYHTLLINLSPLPVHRLAVNDLGFAIPGLPVEHEVIPGQDCEQVMRARIQAQPPGRVNVVLLLPRVDAVVLLKAQRMLRGLPTHALQVA